MLVLQSNGQAVSLIGTAAIITGLKASEGKMVSELSRRAEVEDLKCSYCGGGQSLS